MKTTMIKRYTSLMLSIAMVMSVCFLSASAIAIQKTDIFEIAAKELVMESDLQSNMTQRMTRNVIEEVTEDVTLIYDGIQNLDNLSLYSINEDGNYVYEFKYENGVTSYIDVKQENGRTVLHAVEGELENTLQWCDDGTLILDGIELPKFDPDEVRANAIVSRSTGFYSDYCTTPQNGTVSSDYDGGTKFIHDSTNAVYFGQAIKNIGVVVGAAVMIKYWPCLNILIGATTFTGAMTTLIDYLKDTHPYMEEGSFKDYQVSQVRNINSHLVRNFRHDIKCYPEAGYGGTPTWKTGDYYEERTPT